MVDVSVVRWLRAVSVDPGSPRVSAIDTAAQKIAHEASAQSILHLVESTYLGSENTSYTALLEAVREEDSTFAPSADDLEARLASAVVLYHVLKGETSIATDAGHAILSADWLGLSHPVKEIATLASEKLALRCEASRLRPEGVGSVSAAAALKQRPEMPTAGAAMTAEHGKALVDFVVAAANAVARTANAVNSRLAQQLRASDEELDLLWWAFAGYSEMLERQIAGISNAGHAAISVGSEFAALLKFEEEPMSTRAILDGLLARKGAKQVSLKAAVEATPLAAVTLPDGLQPHRLLPVLSSLHEAVAFDGKATWVESVSRWDIEPATEYSPVSLAQQVVREYLLAWSMTQ